MTKKTLKKTNVEIRDSFKNDKIVFCFLLFSSNKFVEFLLVKLNSFFIKYEYKKKRSNSNRKIIELSVSLENYVMLKKELVFEFNKENLKFKFLFVLLKKKKLSIDFFEKNYLNDLENKEKLVIIDKYISISLLLKNIFLHKFMFLFYFILLNMQNNIKSCILSRINVYNTPSS